MAAKYTFFVQMNATRHWLALSRAQRNDYFSTTVGAILKRYPAVTVRLYDVEAFNSKCSDIAVYESDDIQQYHFLIDALRDSEIYTVPYFNIVEILPAIEEGFIAYEASLD